MKEKRKHCQPAKLILTAVLAIALVLSPSLLTPGLEISSAGVAYADVLEANVELRAVKVDELNDKLVLEAYLSSTSACGLSGIDFRLSWPETFKLTKVEDKGLLGEGDKGTSFSSKELTDNPYYIAFGNMDESAGGVSNNIGAIAYFTFEPTDTSLTSCNYDFSLQDVHAVALSTADEGIKTQSVTINGTQTYTYEAKAGDGTVSGNDGKITVSADESGTPQVKTSTITSAINSAGTSSSITLDASTSASLALGKTGAEAIAKADKNMTVKTNAGELTFDNAAAASIGSNDGGEKLVITTSKQDADVGNSGSTNAMKFSVTAKLVDSSDGEADTETPVTSFGGGEVTVALDLPDSLKSETNLICWNYTDTNYTVVNGDKSSDGNQYVFTTNHFSDYIIGTETTLNAFKDAKNLSEGVTVSGTVTSWNIRNDIIVKLFGGTETDSNIRTAMRNANYTAALGSEATVGEPTKADSSSQYASTLSFEGIANGDYKLAIYKPGKYVVKVAPFTVSGSAVNLGELKLWLYGDVNYNGVVDDSDATQIVRHAALKASIFDSGDDATKQERLLCADVNDSQYVDDSDATQIVRYAALKTSIFDTLK